MIAKFTAVLCFIGLTHASGWHGSDLGYSGYASGLGYASNVGYGLGYTGYVAPTYTAPVYTKALVAAPVVTKTVVPAISYAPAISTVSRYQVHSSPIVKSYVAPVSYASYAAPYTVSYNTGYNGLGYAGHGGYSSGYGYGSGLGQGYGTKYLW